MQLMHVTQRAAVTCESRSTGIATGQAELHCLHPEHVSARARDPT